MLARLALLLPAAVTSFAAELVYSFMFPDPTAQNVITTLAVDAQGNAYIAGYTNSTKFPATPGAFQRQLNGGAPECNPLVGPSPCTDAFVAMLDPSGKIAWATLLGGSGDDSAASIALDRSGNIYVAGSTTSPDFPGSQTRGPAAALWFIAKLSPTGASLAYSFLFYAGDVAGLAVDARGSAYVSGTADNAQMAATAGALRTQPAQRDGYVGKLNESGSAWVYLTFIGGSYDDYVTGIAVDAAGEAFVTGVTRSPDFLGSSAQNQTPVFVTKLDAGGTGVLWTAFLEDRHGIVYSTSVALDAGGGVYVTRGGTAVELVIDKLSPDGSTLVYSRSLAVESQSAPAIVVNGGGRAIVGGSTRSRNLPVTPGAVEGANYVGASAGYVLELDAAGSQVLYASYLGGTTQAAVMGVGTDAAGRLYAATVGYPGFVASTDPAPMRTVWLGAVVNSASYLPSDVAPGELVSLFGTGLGPESPLGPQVENGRLTTRLGDTEVRVNGVAAPLLYVSSGQINAVVPFATDGAAEFVVTVGGQPSNAVTLQSAPPYPGESPASVGIFTRDASGSGQAAVLNQDGTLNSPENPAPRGSIVAVWLTGAGQTDPPSVDGRITPVGELSKLINRVDINLLAHSSPLLLYAGAAPGLIAGIAQINFRIPDDADTGPAVPLSLDIGPRLDQGHLVAMAIQ